jgi:hypothetical protein
MSYKDHEERQKKHNDERETFCGFCRNRYAYNDGICRYDCNKGHIISTKSAKYECEDFEEKF